MVTETFVIQTAFVAAGLLAAGAALVRRGRRAAAAPVAEPAGPSLPPPLPVPSEASLEPLSPYAPPQSVPPALPAMVAEEIEPPRRFKVPVHWYHRLDLPLAGFFFVVYFALASMSGKQDGANLEQKYTPGVMVFSMIFQLVMAGLAVGYMAWRVRPWTWLGLRWPQWPLALGIAPATVFATWMAMGVLQFSGFNEWLQRTLGTGGMQEAVQLLMKGQDPVVLGLMAIAAVIVAPLAEEIVFRGYLYPVAKRFCGMPVAMVCSSLVFAAAHNNAVALVPLFLLAMALCLLYELTGSIWASISVHFLFNGATVALQLLARSGLVPLDPGSQP